MLGYSLKSGDKDSYNKEVNEIKDILNDKRYNELLRLGNLNDGRVKICYVGDDEDIDELIVFGRSYKYGFAVIRVLGDDMEVSKIMELGPIISQLNTEDINVEGFMDFML
jgi:acylphosphatase